MTPPATPVAGAVTVDTIEVRRIPRKDPVDRPAVVEDEQLAVGVLAERADAPDGTELGGVLAQVRRGRLSGGRVHGERDRPLASQNEVGEEVAPDIRGTERRATVDVAAGDRALPPLWEYSWIGLVSGL